MDSNTPDSFLYTKILAELPVLVIYLISARWIVLKFFEGWKYYLDTSGKKEDKILTTYAEIISQINEIKGQLREAIYFYKEADREIRWLKAKISDILKSNNLNKRDDDK